MASGKVESIANIKPVGFLTFREKDITAVPKVFPIYYNSDTYEFIVHAVSNYVGARAIFIIRLDKTTGDVIVERSLNMGAFATYTNFDATYTQL